MRTEHFLFLSTKRRRKNIYFQFFFFFAKRLVSAGLSQSALSKTTTYLESKWKVNSTNPTFFYFLGHNLQWAYWTTCDRATTCCTKCTTCQKAENFERLAPKNRDFWKSLILYKSNEPPKRHRKMKNLEW